MSARGEALGADYSAEALAAATGRPLPPALPRAAAALAAAGALTFVTGLVVAPDRAWQALLVNWNFFALLSSAGVALVAVQRITTARWSRPVLRFAEGYVAFLPVAFLLLLLIVLVGRDHIFPWAHQPPRSPERPAYLHPLFFTVRVIGLFAVITALSLRLVYTSVRLDVGRLPEAGAAWARGLRARMRRGYGDERTEIFTTHTRQGALAVLVALAFGIGWTLLALDLSMSLDLHFEGTLYGWWMFMGGWLAALMAFALLVIAWGRFLPVPGLVAERHLHDVGKLCFAFTAFWGYLTFSQYLVIWYGNLAFETHWIRLRLIRPWLPVTLLTVALTFVLPFLGLLPRAAKVYRPALAGFAGASLAGLWLLRYVEVYPALHYPSAGLPLGVWELGVGAGFLGLWGLSYLAFMDAFPRVRVTLMTSPYRDAVQVPYDPRTFEPLPAHD